MKFMPDPRLQPKPIPIGGNKYPYPSGENQNFSMNESLPNDKGKYLKPPQSGSCHSSSPHVNANSLNFVTRPMKERTPDTRNNDRRIAELSTEDRIGQQSTFGRHESIIVGNSNQQDMNLDSFVHNILDALDVDFAFKDQSQTNEVEDEQEEEDFPTKYANYQRSFEDFEQHAVALPCDPRLLKPTAFSAQPSAMQTAPPKRDKQPTARVKPEPREKITGPERDNLRPENNLKQALEDIRQRQQSTATVSPAASSYNDASRPKAGNITKGKNASERSSKTLTPPNVRSNNQGKSPRQIPDVGNHAEMSRRKVVEDSGSRYSNRSTRNGSPFDGRDRNSAGKSILGSPEWHRQVRMVDNPDGGNRDSRETEMRRVRRISRSRSRSRSPRRPHRYFRCGSPEQRRSRSRSPISKRTRRISPEYPHRRWGAGGPKRNSRSPVGSKDRKRATPDSTHRNVVGRTVIMRRSRSISRSPSRSSSQQQQNTKCLKEQPEGPKELKKKPPNNVVVNTQQTTQLFTRNYGNQVNHVAHVVQSTQQVAAPVDPRYIAPPTSLSQSTSAIPTAMGYYNQQIQHCQTPVQQQQLDMATYHQQQLHQQQLHQQQFHQQLLVQQQFQQQLYQRHLQQINPNSVLQNVGPSHLFPASHPAGSVQSPNIPPPQQTVPPPTPPSTSATVVPTNSEKGSVEEQRLQVVRDGLLEKQMNLIHQLLVVQTQQADLEMKQKTAEEAEYENFSLSILEKAKFGKEMMVSAQALEKIILKHTNQLKEDLYEIKKTRLSNRYNYYDPQQHWCELCDVITDKLNDYLNHLHSKEHAERLKSTGVPSTPWHKKNTVVPEEKGGIRIPFNGLQNLQPVKAWYCELCDVWMGDLHCAQLHMTSSGHNDQHLKRSMERPDSALTQTVKKQAALRRNAARKKEEERAKIRQKEVDRLKMEAEKKEAARKKETEKQEKQRRIEQKRQEFVRNEEANNTPVAELEGEPSGEKDETNKLQAESSHSARIRLNIRTPITSSKVTEQKDSTEITSSITETCDSVVEKAVNAPDGTAKTNSLTKPFPLRNPVLDKDCTKRRIVEEIQTETAILKLAEKPISSIEGYVSEVVQKNSLAVADTSKDVPENYKSTHSKKLAANTVDALSKHVVPEEKDLSDQMNLKPETVCQTDFVSSSSVNVPAQLLPISQTDACCSSTVPVSSAADGKEVKSNQKLIDEKLVHQLDTNVQKCAIFIEKAVMEGDQKGFLDAEANVENTQDFNVRTISFTKNSKISGQISEPATCSEQPSDLNRNESEEKTPANEEKGRLLPKLEPIYPEDPTNDCCVILEVNPKLDKIPELIDLESSAEDCNPPTVDSRMSQNSENTESVEEKCDSLYGSANRSSTPCGIRFGEFIVLSETHEDSCIDTDSSTSVNSSLETSSGERRVDVKDAPADEASTSQVP
ncbi:uncharacterized protein LOC130701093 isoform X2 [Daphnia carinata]|nr:uncharacterized protein LOC130701093 isoform X2 [Daphnia carinata]